MADDEVYRQYNLYCRLDESYGPRNIWCRHCMDHPLSFSGDGYSLDWQCPRRHQWHRSDRLALTTVLLASRGKTIVFRLKTITSDPFRRNSLNTFLIERDNIYDTMDLLLTEAAGGFPTGVALKRQRSGVENTTT